MTGFDIAVILIGYAIAITAGVLIGWFGHARYRVWKARHDVQATLTELHRGWKR